MGQDVAEVDHRSQGLPEKKLVLGPLCSELSKIVDMILSIIPAIESARPGGSSGIQELCYLNNEIDKARLLLQHLTDSSSFYLAMTGDAVILRCERRRNALHESLTRILTMVPDPLASQVLEISSKLRGAKFGIDPVVEEAGRGINSVIEQSNPSEDAEFRAFCNAAVKLSVISPRARIVEKRSIKRLRDQLRGSDPRKETTLKYLLYLFRKYEKRLISEDFGQKGEDQGDTSGMMRSGSAPEDQPAGISNRQVEQKNDPSADSLPKEFLCPLSLELMRDPVVIASGETFERAAIAQWFRDGHDVCPRTGKKMTSFAMVSNSCMKTLISNWCEKRGIFTSGPAAPLPENFALHSWNNLNSCSIASVNVVPASNIAGRMADYDCSNVSILSSDGGYLSDSGYIPQVLPDIDEGSNGQPFDQDLKYQNFFSHLSDQTAESQAKAVAELRVRLQNEEERQYMLSGGFLDALVLFLKDAYHLSRVRSQKIGLLILLTFLEEARLEASQISEDMYDLLISFLDSEVTHEALMVLQIISRQPKISLLGIRPLMRFLDSGSTEFLELVLDILCNFSSGIEGKLEILSAGAVSMLLPHLSSGNLARNCLKLLQSLCGINQGKAAITKMEGCVPAIAELLDSSSREEQAHSAAILHALCSSCPEYCSLVMKEGIVPSLVHISVNGSSQGKQSSMKLLQLLRDFRDEDQDHEEISCSPETTCPEPPQMVRQTMDKKQSASGKPGFLRKMFHLKPKSVSLF